MLLTRYGAGYSDILALDFLEASEIINYALEQKSEDFLKLRWAIHYDEMSFDDFKEKLGAKKEVVDKPVKDILADVFKVIKDGGVKH